MVTVSTLLDSMGDALIWCGGRAGAGKAIADAAAAPPLIGVYNPARKLPIQVLAAAELQHIEHGVVDTTTGDLFHDHACLIVIADGCPVPTDLVTQAEERGVALLRTDLDERTLLASLYRRMDSLTAPSAHMHGVLLSLAGTGTLILGPPGVGKSSLALELLGRGHQLVDDDDVSLYRDADGALWSDNQRPSELRGFLFVRGLGMIDVMAEFGPFALCSRVEVTQLIRLGEGPVVKQAVEQAVEQAANIPVADGLQGDVAQEEVLGIKLPCLRIRALCTAADRVESYTRRRLLAAAGYDGPAAFRARLAAMLTTEKVL